MLVLLGAMIRQDTDRALSAVRGGERLRRVRVCDVADVQSLAATSLPSLVPFSSYGPTARPPSRHGLREARRSSAAAGRRRELG